MLAGLCIIAVWVVAGAAVLPYAVYIKHFALEDFFGEQFSGAELCSTNIHRHVEEYIRAIFVIMYCLPLGVIASLFIKVSMEIKSTGSSLPPTSYRIVDIGNQSCAATSDHVSYYSQVNIDRIDRSNSTVTTTTISNTRNNCNYSDADSIDDDEVDMWKESRSQKFLIAMVTIFAVCWCPINILTIVTHFVYEDDENVGHFDITYLVLTFIGFVSTCANPVLFLFWNISDETKDRLCSYFKIRQSIAKSPSSQRVNSGDISCSSKAV